MNGEQYMAVLEARRDAYIAANPHQGPSWLMPPLELFVRDGDEQLVTLPDPPPPTPKPSPPRRRRRTAASLRAERDQVQAELDGLNSTTEGDTGMVNLSPLSRSRAAAAAGRRRMAALDRDVARAAALLDRLAGLDARIARADAVERRTS